MSIQLQDLRAKVSDDATFDSDAVIDGEKGKRRIKTVVHIVFDEDPFVKGSTDCTPKALALIRTKVAGMMVFN
jgi:hypothetical protein